MRCGFSWLSPMFAWGFLLAVLVAPAEVARADESPKAPGARPDVSLDRLFELPRSFEPAPAEVRAGEGENAWRQRFAEARAAVERSQSRLNASKRELAELAEESNAWTLAPPVGGAAQSNPDAPLSFELRQRIKRQEAEVSDAKGALLNLEIEANLAGVPEAWRAAVPREARSGS